MSGMTGFGYLVAGLISIIPHKFPAPIVEIFHRLIGRVENYPLMPYGLFALFVDPFNLSVPEVFKMFLATCVYFLCLHFIALLCLVFVQVKICTVSFHP